MTNYEKIKNMSVEEMAKGRIKCEYISSTNMCFIKGDFDGVLCGNTKEYEKALKKEIEWLNKEVSE